jgi:hypothetical protein
MMKKKIINGILMFALLVSGMNAFVSCKDIDDENYITVQRKINENITLTTLLQQQYAELKTALDNIKECECATKGYITKADADATYLSKTDAANLYLTKSVWQTTLIALQKQDSLLTVRLNQVEATLNGRIDQVDSVLNGRIDQVDSVLQAHADSISNLAYQISQNNITIINLTNTVNQIDSLAKANQVKIDNLSTTVTNLSTSVIKLDSLSQIFNTNITNLNTKVSNLDSLVAGWSSQLTTVSEKATDAYNRVVLLETYAQNCRNSIDSLADVVANLVIPELSGYYTKAQIDSIVNGLGTPTVDAYTKHQVDSLLNTLNIPSIEGLVTQDYLDSIMGTLNIPDVSDFATKAQLDSLAQIAKAAVDSVGSIASQAVTDAATALTAAQTAQTTAQSAQTLANQLNTTVGQLQTAVEQRVTKTEYQQKINEVENNIQTVNTSLDNLLDKLSQDLRHMITNIIVQGTKNPIIGYANAPIDVRSLILAAYKGYSDTGFEFPARQAADYLNETDFERYWTTRRLHVLGVNSIKELEGWQKYEAGNFIDEREGNAGKVYLTINPTSVDFDNTKLKGLYTSQGRKSPISLSNVRTSKDELTFGYTRGGNSEGFYEADATLKKEDMGSAAGIDVEFRTLASEIKTALQKRDKSSLMVLANDILRNASNITPAYAVKVSWTDSINGDEHDIISQYGIAATAIKPLSYSFMKDYKRNSMPGFGRLQDLVGRIINTIDSHINLDLPDFSKYEGSITFKDIELPTIDDDMLRITYNKTYTSEDLAGSGKLYGDTENVELFFLVTNVKDGKYALVGVDDNGNNILYIRDTVTDMWRPATADEIATWGAIEFGLTVDVDINKTEDFKETLQEIIDSLNDDFGAESDLAKTMTDLLNDIASMGDLDEKIHSVIKDDLKSTINEYLTRINNRLTKWFNNAHKALYITMLGEQNNALGVISESRYRPTKAKAGSVTLRPTSFSFEYFAPAYKKFVGISNVYKASDKSELPEALAIQKASDAKGNNMGKVITPSLTHDDEVIIKGEAGYIYEILYTAVDYHGVSTIKKFYIQF